MNDSLVKSKTYKWNSKFFLVREIQKKFKTALCGAIQNGFFQSHHKNKGLGLCLLWSCHCFVDGSSIHLVDFYDTPVNNIWFFPNQIPGSLDYLTLSCLDKANVRERSLQVWLWLPFRVFLPESTAFCPKIFKNFCDWFLDKLRRYRTPFRSRLKFSNNKMKGKRKKQQQQNWAKQKKIIKRYQWTEAWGNCGEISFSLNVA